MDVIPLNALYQITQVSKSAALALTLLYQEDTPEKARLSLEDAVNISRIDEHF
jgi:chaperone required for assembly of F1-ATPase